MLRKIWLPILAVLMLVGVGVPSGQAAPLAPAAKTEIGSNVVQVQHRHHHHRRHHHMRRHHHHHHVRPHVIVVPRVHHHRHHHHRRHYHHHKRW